MELDESHRRELLDSLAATLGDRPAATLMAHLPPVGWADVATKHDLNELERRIDMRFEVVDHRLDGLDRRLDGIDHRLDGLDHRLDGLDHRLDGIDNRLDPMDDRLDQVQSHLGALDGRIGTMDGRFGTLAGELRREMTKQTYALLFGLGSLMLTLAGVIIAALHFSSG